ncbi:MAG: NYN domain-containing protein [Candidatus Pacebacteria bacterium]|nr:NYN domain-containing protein [Candidatus Paceibacterota bacterium]
MIGQFIKGKTAVFIDAANVFYSERSLGWRIDYARLAEYLQQESSAVELYYYTGIIEKSEKQRAFLKKLESFGYIVTAKEVKFIRQTDGSFMSKGSLDIELALDAYIVRQEYDTCVLFSGDSDFAYLLDILKREGKRVVVVSTRGHVSKELVARAKYVALPKLRKIIGRDQKFKRPDKPASEV